MSEMMSFNEQDYMPKDNTNQESKSVTTEAMVGRQAQEVQAAMVVAKQFPRSTTQSFMNIMKACERKMLAETAIYQFPRGKQKVSGPSIRLAEVLAQNWGNVDYGVLELEQKNGESTVMAYAWDLETNTRQTKTFTVKHERKANGSVTKLVDPRDIYEMVANQGARRVRACILGVIPGDIVDAAMEKCKQTLIDGYTDPLEDRLRKMLMWFKDQYSVTQAMIEDSLGKSLDAFNEQDYLKVRQIASSLKDGMGKVEDYFKTKNTAATKSKSEEEFENQSKQENSEKQDEKSKEDTTTTEKKTDVKKADDVKEDADHVDADATELPFD